MNKENQDPTTPQDAKNSSKPGRGKLNQSAVCKSGNLSKLGNLCKCTCEVLSSAFLDPLPSLFDLLSHYDSCTFTCASLILPLLDYWVN